MLQKSLWGLTYRKGHIQGTQRANEPVTSIHYQRRAFLCREIVHRHGLALVNVLPVVIAVGSLL